MFVGRLAHPEKVDPQALQVYPERLEDLEKWERRDPQVHWVLKGRQESLVHQVCLDSLEREVCQDFR